MPSPCSAEIATGSPRPRAKASSAPASPARPFRLVGDEHDRLADDAEELGEVRVERRHAGARVDHEEAEIGRADRRFGLRAHAAGEAVRRRFVEAGGIDGGEAQVAETRLALAAVAGDAGQIVDQRQPPADQPVEQRRLADIRPADDGDAEGLLAAIERFPSAGAGQPSGCVSGFGGCGGRRRRGAQ